MKNIISESQDGKSLVELIIVLVIIAIVSVFTLTQFGNTKNRFQRQNMARELKVYLERARFDSVKRRAVAASAQAKVEILDSTTFRVTTDINFNGTIDANDIKQYSFSQRSFATIVGSGLVFPVTVLFDQRGQANITDGNGTVLTNPVFTVCDGGCTASTANADNSTIVGITPTGTIVMANGGTTIANVNAPTVTNVSTNANINCLVKSSSNVACTSPTP